MAFRITLLFLFMAIYIALGRACIIHELCHALAIKRYKPDASIIIKYRKACLYEKHIINALKGKNILFLQTPEELKKLKCLGITLIEGHTYRETFTAKEISVIALAGVFESFFRTCLVLSLISLYYLNTLERWVGVSASWYIKLIAFLVPFITFIIRCIFIPASDLSVAIDPKKCKY